MLILTLPLKSILNCFQFGIYDSVFGLMNLNASDLHTMQRGVEREIMIGEGSLFWFTALIP